VRLQESSETSTVGLTHSLYYLVSRTNFITHLSSLKAASVGQSITLDNSLRGLARHGQECFNRNNKFQLLSGRWSFSLGLFLRSVSGQVILCASLVFQESHMSAISVRYPNLFLQVYRLDPIDQSKQFLHLWRIGCCN